MAGDIDIIDAITEQWEPRLRQAFLDAVAKITDTANLQAIVDALARGDIEGAIRAVSLDPAQFVMVQNAVSDMVRAGGEGIVETIRPLRSPDRPAVKISFNVRNPDAEAWISERSSTLVTEIADDQRQTIRQHLTAGLAAGQNPRAVALDLVGRKSRVTGVREGGVIGLTSQQEAWQRAYLAEISSSDPAMLSKALARGLRDKRFDASIKRAIRTGEQIPKETQARMVAAYRDRTLKYRADVIARNETVRALGAAQRLGYQQAIDAGQIQASALSKFWITVGDSRVRPEHRLIPGMNKDGRAWDEAFQTPHGPSMFAPHDTDPLCRCKMRVKINYFADID